MTSSSSSTHAAKVRARLLSAGVVRPEPGTVVWNVNREAIVVAGWGRAVLLQLAHPLIAAAVADHSSFRGGSMTGFKRLSSTVGAMLALTFGTDDEAIGAAAGITCIHDRVSGRLREPVGTLDAGTVYSAHDPELLRWVHVTLLESILLAYEQLVGRLTTEERDRYCTEAAIMEPLLGIPEGLLPRDSAQLDACIRGMLESHRITVSAQGRALGHAILFPPGWRLMWPAFRALQLLSIGQLPTAIRDAYGFTWTPRDARALARWTAALRRLRRAVPPFVREWPAARRRQGRATQKSIADRAGSCTANLERSSVIVAEGTWRSVGTGSRPGWRWWSSAWACCSRRFWPSMRS